MTPQIVDDLKQFIQAAFVQYGSEIAERFDGIDARLDGVDQQLNGLQTQVTEFKIMLNTNMNAVGETFADHEHHIAKLEARPA